MLKVNKCIILNFVNLLKIVENEVSLNIGELNLRLKIVGEPKPWIWIQPWWLSGLIVVTLQSVIG